MDNTEYQPYQVDKIEALAEVAHFQAKMFLEGVYSREYAGVIFKATIKNEGVAEGVTMLLEFNAMQDSNVNIFVGDLVVDCLQAVAVFSDLSKVFKSPPGLSEVVLNFALLAVEVVEVSGGIIGKNA